MGEIQLNDIIILAKQTGEILRKGYFQHHQIDSKGHSDDPVTETDKKSEDFILEQLSRLAPGHAIVTEESGIHSGDSSHVWYIDPLDGTMNFAHGSPFFVFSIGYEIDGVMQMGVVYDPMHDECYYAQKGKGAFRNGTPIHVSAQTELKNALLSTGFMQKAYEEGINNFPAFRYMNIHTAGVRRIGCAALELSYVACGRYDGFWDRKLRPWDVAAGFLIIREAGGTVTTLSGDPDVFKEPYEFLAANPVLHPQLLQKLQALEGK